MEKTEEQKAIQQHAYTCKVPNCLVRKEYYEQLEAKYQANQQKRGSHVR